MKIKQTLAAALLICFAAFPSYAEQASAESVKQLIQKTGGANLAKQMLQQMLPMLKSVAPKASNQFWQEVVDDVDMEGIIEKTVPIYQKHFTEYDVQELLKFYNTPVGEKMIKATPQITQESMIIGQQWGQELAMQILAKYKAEYGN